MKPPRRARGTGRRALQSVWLLSVLLAAAPAGAGGRGAASAVNENSVKRAIDLAVDYLYAAANKDGIWDQPARPDFKSMLRRWDGNTLMDCNWPGKTALVLNALASAGQQKDPRFRKAVDWLMAQDMMGTYGLGMRMELVHRLPDSRRYRSVLKKDARTLLRALRSGDEGTMWQYMPPPGKSFYSYIGDFSNTNYGVLGLWAASDERLEIPARVWRGLERTYLLGQLKCGAWTYYHACHVPPNSKSVGHAPSASMTTAGIASLYLIIDRVHVPGAGLGAFRRSDAYKSIRRGLEWMQQHFSATTNPGWPEFATYYFYNCERVAAAAGLKYFGTHDWFREIAATLLKAQAPGGAIPYKTTAGYGGVIVDTSFALLFLAKGSAPVIFNKLQHPGDWDNRIRDLAALTDWLARQSERPANWQVVNLDVPPEEWTDSRILYVAGTRPLRLDEAQRGKLKRFVELGGLLVFQPDAPSRAFEASVAALLAELWPRLELSEVDLAAHPLGRIYLPPTGARIRLQQLASPTRVLAFVLHGAPAEAWERRQYVTGKGMFDLGANLHYFANDRCPLRKMPTKLTHFAEPFRKPVAGTERSVTLARIRYGRNRHHWDPEPLAFERFGRLLAAREKVRCEVKVVTPEQLAGSGAKIAHLTGTGPLEFGTAQWEAIQVWLLTGGTLLADQAGGPRPGKKDTFDASFRGLVAKSFGRGALGVMPSVHPLLKGLGKVSYRNVGGDRRGLMRPKLEWVSRGGRAVIVYSRYDLTGGLLGCPNPLVSGAGEQGAYDIVSRLVLGSGGAK